MTPGNSGSVILKTEAVALQIRPFANTSHIVTWLVPERGLLTTSIRGACRTKSAFLGQYDLGYTCELLYYARERDGIHIARECTPLERHDRLRSDWRACLAALYCCDLLARVAESGPAAGDLYQLLQSALARLSEEGADAGLLLWFEMRLLLLLGLEPDLNGCPHCLDNGSATLRFVVAEGRVACQRCLSGERQGVTFGIAPAGAAALRRAAGSAEPPRALFAPFSAAARLALRRFLGLFMRYHLDLPLENRGIAWEACQPDTSDV